MSSEDLYEPTGFRFTRSSGKRPVLMHVPLMLHERLGNWARQLRPRLHNLPIRWFETRSRADLDDVL